MNLKNFAFILSILSFTSITFGQKIEIRMAGMSDTVYLAKYRGKSLTYADTAISKGNKAIFDTKGKDYQPGMMAFLTKDQKGFFQFIYNFEDVTIEATTEDAMKNAKVIKSVENKFFYDYLAGIVEKKSEMQKLKVEEQKETDAKKKEAIKEKIKNFNESVQAWQLKIAEDNKGLLAAALVKASVDIKIPDKPEGEDDAWQFRYYLKHYWDNVDWTMPGIQNAEIVHAKMEYFFGDKLMLAPDTIIKYADILVSKTKEGSETFRYVVSHITSTYEKSKILGMDAVFVHMGQKYYCPANNSKAFWMSQEQLEKLCERVTKWGPLVIGAKAPYLKLPDSTETKWISFYDMQAEYKILYFWDPDCGHCKKTTPKLQTLYEKKFKDRGIEIYSIGKAQGEDFEKWKKYIRTNNLTFINVGLTKKVFEDATDPNIGAGKYYPQFVEKGVDQNETLKRLNQSMNYTTTYDIFSTPRVFVLDKDNKIVAKSLSIAQLEEFLDRLQGKESEPKLFPVEEEAEDEKLDH